MPWPHLGGTAGSLEVPDDFAIPSSPEGRRTDDGIKSAGVFKSLSPFNSSVANVLVSQQCQLPDSLLHVGIVCNDHGQIDDRLRCEARNSSAANVLNSNGKVVHNPTNILAQRLE